MEPTDQKPEIELTPHKVVVVEDDGSERDESPYQAFFVGNSTPMDDWSLVFGIVFAAIVIPPITRLVKGLFGL